MFNKFTTVVLGAVLLTCVLTTGCSKEKTEEITVYTAIEDNRLDEYINQFNKVYPQISVDVIRDATGSITTKLLAEKSNPNADVVWGVSASSLEIMDKEKMLSAYSPMGLENINNKFIDNKNNIPHWVGLGTANTVLCINEKELENKKLPIPRSYKDLLNPIYKGEIVMPNPSTSGTGYQMVAGIIQSEGEIKAWDYMDSLNENVKMYTHSGMAPIKNVASGEQSIGIGVDFESIQEENKYGNVKTIFPKEGLFGEIEGVALINKKEINPNAKIFVDWAISKDAMELYSKYRGLVSNEEVECNSEYPKNYKSAVLINNPKWSSENRSRILEQWDKRYN